MSTRHFHYYDKGWESEVLEYGLSAYDASYLDVAIRHGAPLATLDSGLEEAGRKAGVEILSGPERLKLKRCRKE